MKKIKNRGFTLIELLVVIAIIGILSTLAVIALNTARMRARDARRVSDMRQFQTAMEMVFSDTSDYAASGCDTAGATADKLHACTGAELRTYLPGIVNLRDPVARGVGANCTSVSNTTCDYAYVAGTPPALSYTAWFFLEGRTGEFNRGPISVGPGGFRQ